MGENVNDKKEVCFPFILFGIIGGKKHKCSTKLVFCQIFFKIF